jgi:hypothetical protein
MMMILGKQNHWEETRFFIHEPVHTPAILFVNCCCRLDSCGRVHNKPCLSEKV